jgi:ketosteroid isomerase-like protein
VSAENVELVRGLQPAPDADLTELFRDDDTWASLVSVMAELFHPRFECIFRRFDAEKMYAGLDGLRDLWLDWLAPWATYRTETEEVIDLGDRVLVVVRDFGRHEASIEEVELPGTAIWTVHDGKIVRAVFYPIRAEALKAAGLEP